MLHASCKIALNLTRSVLAWLPLFCYWFRRYYLLLRSYSSGIWFYGGSNTSIQTCLSYVKSWRCILLMPCHKLILLTRIGQSYDTSGVIKWKRTKQQRTDSLDAWRCGKMIWKEFQIKLKLTNGKLIKVCYWFIVRTQEVAPHQRSVRVARGDGRV